MYKNTIEEATNALFLNLVNKLGEIYLLKGKDYTLSLCHKEERWEWVTESFLKKSLLFHKFLSSKRAQNLDIASCSLESLLEFASNNELQEPKKGNILGGYLKKYLKSNLKENV